MHKADNPKDALTLVMSIGNGSRRMVSKHTTRGKNEETQTSIKTNLLVSSEDTLQVFARKHGIHIDGGIMARYFEVEKGEYGMFDDLCGHANGDEMSKKLDQLSMAHEGAVWPSWISRLSANWEKVIRWYGRNMSIIRDDIMQSAGDPKFDDVTNRVVDSLTFAAFAGCVASKLGILEVERTTITAAFGLMVKEHVDRQPAPATPSAQICIDALRGYLQANQAKFLSIDDFDSQPQSNEMVVYKHNGRKHGSLFLFPVPTFRNKFVKQYGNEIFEHLRTAGYLASQPGRNNRMTLRIPPQDGKEVEFPSFIAIKKSILDVEADE
jgi:hypothetical protein